MEIDLPDTLAALAHPNRLSLFRLLMRRYPDAVPAGEIAAALNFKPNTASAYLAALKQAGLIAQRRRGTSSLYRADLAGLRGLFDGLMEGCCQNRAGLCLPPWPKEAPVPAPERPLNVLFLCSGNSARSLMAEALLTRLGGGGFRAFSAGTQPADTPQAGATALLQSKGFETSLLLPKPLDYFASGDAPMMDFTITLCDFAANEEPPAWPGQPLSAHWGMPDPVSAGGTAGDFQDAFAQLHARIQSFTALPFDTLDTQQLQDHLDRIGQMQVPGQQATAGNSL